MTDSSTLQSLIDAIDQADSSEQLIAAVQALASARLEDGIPTLIRVLGYNNPGAAMVAVNSLVQMGEAAVMPLLTLLDDYNYGARAYAIRALASIGDPRALEVLLAAAETDFAPSVRRAATKGLGALVWHRVSTEQRAIAQAQVLAVLRQISQDADWSLRYAAIVGLQGLAITAKPLIHDILTHLQQIRDAESDSVVQARLEWACHQIAQSVAVDVSNPTLVPLP